MRTRKVPQGARHLRTYAEFESYLVDFVRGGYPFLWIVGRPGVAKTESIRAAVRGQSVYCRKGGQITPMQLYLDCYAQRGKPIVLDDAEHLLENKIGSKLISALGDTTPAKYLSWGSTSPRLGGVPQSYFTTSTLCVIANKTTADAAIQSRAVLLYFDPTNKEIHLAAARWFWDQEIHDWFGQHLCRLPPLDARWYVKAHQDKQSDRDWRQIALKAHAPSRAAVVVQDLEGDPAYPTRKDKERRFAEMVGGDKGSSRATYHRLRAKLEREGRLIVQPVPPIPLRHTRPPGVPSLAELDAMEEAAPDQVEDEPRPLDLPVREGFAQPICGQTPAPTPAQPLVLDDLLPGERREDADDDSEDAA
jgi:hypothetical protein